MISEKNYEKVPINGLFDLEKFAKEYDMAADELVKFHNQHCNLQEIITRGLSKYVSHIYIPTEKYLVRQTRLLKTLNLMLPDTNSIKNYGVIQKFLPKELQIHYQIKIKRSQNHMEITKEKSFVNHREISRTIEQLFEKAQQTLYPLQISLDTNGGLRSIENTETINKKWTEDVLPQMKTYYQSETTDEIFEKLNNAFKHLAQKKNLLKRNIFYSLFLLPIYQDYHAKTKKDSLQIFFNTIAEEINYEVEYSLQPEFTRGNKIALQITGMEEETFLNKNREKGKIELLYKLDKETQEIFSITGFATTFNNDIEQKIEFQLYELKNS